MRAERQTSRRPAEGGNLTQIRCRRGCAVPYLRERVILERRVDQSPDMLRLFGLTVSLLASLTGCQQPIAGPAGTHVETGRANALPPQFDPQYLLTARGDYVLSNPPPGVEISFGSKQVRRVGWDDAVEAPGQGFDRRVVLSAGQRSPWRLPRQFSLHAACSSLCVGRSSSLLLT